MLGNSLPFGEETYIKRDSIYNSLLAEDDRYDTTVAMILPLIFKALLIVAKNMYKDHLPGGSFHKLNVTKEMIEKNKRGVQAQCVCKKHLWVLRSHSKIQTQYLNHCM